MGEREIIEANIRYKNIQNIARVEKELDTYLVEQRSKVQIPSLQYIHVAGIEVILTHTHI